MSDTSLRYLTMLQLIPRYPQAVNTLDLHKKLDDAGFSINLRSIQRDLEKLSTNFPLICDEDTRPFRWSFSPEASAKFLPALDIPSAIALELARAYLRPLLPPKVLDHLKPHFDEAETVLKRNGNSISHWPEKIRFLSRGFIGKRPEINAQHLEDLAEAILKKEKCQVSYQARKWPEKETIIIKPVGLVFRDPNTYVLAEIEGKENVRQLPLHRFFSVEKLNASFHDDFNIDDFIDSGEMHILHSRKPVNLTIVCDKPVMNHLIETPLDESQVISEETDESFKLTVQLSDTTDLRWWLIAQSAHIQIIEPRWLKDEIINSLITGLNKQK
jgi:predicted DNA-binding transcriptional regulator YafY